LSGKGIMCACVACASASEAYSTLHSKDNVWNDAPNNVDADAKIKKEKVFFISVKNVQIVFK